MGRVEGAALTVLPRCLSYRATCGIAALVLRWVLDHGVPVSTIEITDTNGYQSVS